MLNNDVVVLRIRKGTPGMGRKLSRAFSANEVTCGHKPSSRVPSGSMILNYGRSKMPIWAQEAIDRGCYFMNSPKAVGKCVDKLKTLTALAAAGVPSLEFCDNKDMAMQWRNAGIPIIVRHTTKGKKGNGVELVQPDQYLPEAPLYTKFYDKTHEFRVHIVNGKVIDYVQKKRMGEDSLKRMGITEANHVVRNHARGWVFAHQKRLVSGRKQIEQMCLDAAAAIGIDYCGVDVLARYTEDRKMIDAVVCEINSAPSMRSPTTFKAYVAAFKEAMTK